MRHRADRVLPPAPKERVRRRAPGEAVAAEARGIVDELQPRADQVPPPVLGAAVQRHLQEMERLLGWLRG